MNKKPLTDESGEVRELTSDDMRGMRSAAEVLPAELVALLPARKPGSRGLQQQPTKVLVTVRYSPEVIAYFRATGKGWQHRMDAALKQYITSNPL
jgi:uncharacterized protein (DUF4415 family)